MYQLGQISGAAVLDTDPFKAGLNSLLSMAKGAAGVLAGYLSARALIAFGAESYNMFSEAQSAEMGLASVLRANGELVEQNMTRYKAFASQLQKITEYGDDETLSIMQRGLAYKIEANRIEGATKAAMGLAARYGRDVNEAMLLIGKAAAGNTRTLAQWGITLDENATKEQKFNALLKIGSDSFGMVTDKMAANKGIMTQLNNYWGDFREAIGQLITYLFDLDEPFTATIEWLSKMTETVTRESALWAYQFKIFYTEVQASIQKIWAVVEPVITLCAESFMNFFSYVFELGGWFVENWSKIWENLGTVAGAVWSDIKQTADNVFELIRVRFTSEVTFWGDVIASFGRNWSSIFTDIWEICKRTLSSIGQYFRAGIENIAKMAASLGSNFWDLVTGRKSFSQAIGGVFDDYMKSVKNIQDKISAEWDGFKFGEGTKQFGNDVGDAMTRHVERMGAQAAKTFANLGKNTEIALRNIGASALPEIKAPDYGKMVSKYKNLNATLTAIDREKEEKQRKAAEQYENRKNRKEKEPRRTAKDAIQEEAAKSTSAGSFSAAMLQGIFGVNSPLAATARYTRKTADNTAKIANKSEARLGA